jgi:hypothetical protein
LWLALWDKDINSISSIARITTRRDIDGFVDGVDFLTLMTNLHLMGRLLIKTERIGLMDLAMKQSIKSNTKIECVHQGGLFTFSNNSDGSRSWYGSTSDSIQNTVSATAWHIVRYEDVNGNRIDYNYTNTAYNNTVIIY